MKSENFTLLGNEDTKKHFASAFSAGKIAHAYIFEGAQGSGKKTLARRVCMMMACDTHSADPCGNCENCIAISKGLCPDIYILTVADGKKTIGVDEVRDFFSGAALTPSVLDFKVYIIDSADMMTVQAQNALLKIIEEPPAYTYIFLLCENSEKLLPTVRSRAQKIIMQTLPPAVIEEYIKQRGIIYDEESLSFAIRNSKGSIGRAVSLLTEKTRDKEAYDSAERIINALSMKNGEVSYFAFLKLFSEKASDRELLLKICECLSGIYSDIIAYTVKNSNETECLRVERIRQISLSVGTDSAVKCIEILRDAVLFLRMNTNINLISTTLAAQLWNNT